MLTLLLQQTPGWKDQHNVHMVGLLMLLLAGFALLLVRRRYALVPIILVTMFVTVGQRIVVFDLDFSFLRILIILGWMRIWLRGEGRGFRMMPLDWMVVGWAASFTLIKIAREGAVVYCSGWLLENIGAYFLFRTLVRSWEEVTQFVKWFALLAVPVAAFFLVEKLTQYNIFSVFGGVKEVTALREGKLRCMGPFLHPILAGCMFASLFPLFAGLWFHRVRSNRILITSGMISAIVIVFCSASSTPVVALAAAMGAVFVFPLRKHLAYIRWGAAVAVVSLHLVMKAPVWHLIARIDLSGGSTGYHRYRLVDAAINRFSDWALLGVSDTGYWGHYLFDVTCFYVLQCSQGGLLTFLWFLAILALAFRGVGYIVTANATDRSRVWFAFLLGVSLLSTCMSFVAVSYFGKPLMLWHLQVATVASLQAATLRHSAPSLAPHSAPPRPRTTPVVLTP